MPTPALNTDSFVDGNNEHVAKAGAASLALALGFGVSLSGCSQSFQEDFIHPHPKTSRVSCIAVSSGTLILGIILSLPTPCRLIQSHFGSKVHTCAD